MTEDVKTVSGDAGKLAAFIERIERLEEEKNKFEERLKNNESGIMFTDLSTEYTHIPRDIKLVDSETIKFFYDTIQVRVV